MRLGDFVSVSSGWMVANSEVIAPASKGQLRIPRSADDHPTDDDLSVGTPMRADCRDDAPWRLGRIVCREPIGPEIPALLCATRPFDVTIAFAGLRAAEVGASRRSTPVVGRSHPELPQMMVEMLVHQDGPLLRRHFPKEAMRIVRTRCCSSDGKSVNQFQQPLPFFVEVTFSRHAEARCSRRILP